jgi:hypothetical protein
MTFAQAKGIGLMFNAFAGRSMQALIAVFTYRAFMKSLMRVSEKTALPYELFGALSLSTTRISAIKPLCKVLFSTLSHHARFTMAWLLISTIYLAIFPTLIDAVSGYQATTSTNVRPSEGSFIIY